MSMRSASVIGQDPAGVAGGDHTRGNVPGNDAARADDRIVPNGNAWGNDYPAAQPDVILDRDRFGCLNFMQGAVFAGVQVALPCQQRVSGSKEENARADKNIVAEADLCTIQKNSVEVDKAAAANVGVAAVIELDRWQDAAALADAAEQFG